MLDRRTFLESLGGGFLLLLTTHELNAQESGRAGRRTSPELPQSVSAWLHIAPDNSITVFTGKVEVGQNIRTSLTQAVADELRCQPSSIKLVMGDTAFTPWDAGTFGSRTTPTMAPQLRRVAATARETLIDQASTQWSADRSTIKFENGILSAPPSGKHSTYGELASAINWVSVIAQADHVTPPSKWHIAGANVPKIDAKDIVTGAHKYASDHTLPGMLHGRVLRPPSFGAKLVSADTTAASKMEGVHVIRDGDFIGVAATDEQKAQRALLTIDAKWTTTPQISSS